MSDSSDLVRPYNYAALFTNPPENSVFPYNTHDHVNVTWTSWAANSSVTTLEFWYWVPSFGGSLGDLTHMRAYPGSQQTVSQNGSTLYTLPYPQDLPSDVEIDHYTGWWLLNFTRQDQSPPSGATWTSAVNCTLNTTKPAHTWDANGVESDPIYPSISPSSTLAPTVSLIASNSPASAQSQEPSIASDALSPGATVGIVIGVVAAVAIISSAAIFSWVCWRRSRSTKAAVLYQSSSYADKFGSSRDQNPFIDANQSSLSELPSNLTPTELSAGNLSRELDSSSVLQELPTDTAIRHRRLGST